MRVIAEHHVPGGGGYAYCMRNAALPINFAATAAADKLIDRTAEAATAVAANFMLTSS